MSAAGGTLRAFLALEIPECVKEQLAVQHGELRRSLPDARWVRPAQQHLTLKFLGETPLTTLQALSTDLRSRLAGLGSVEVKMGGAGFFPSPRRPRIAWLGGEAEGVAPVVVAVEAVSVGHGFSAEARPWRLHVTQARLKQPWTPDAVARFEDWGRNVDLPSFTCSEVVLFSSVLGPGGAVYQALERMPLTCAAS